MWWLMKWIPQFDTEGVTENYYNDPVEDEQGKQPPRDHKWSGKSQASNVALHAHRLGFPIL
jgi:hypothetical protein